MSVWRRLKYTWKARLYGGRRADESDQHLYHEVIGYRSRETVVTTAAFAAIVNALQRVKKRKLTTLS